MAACVFRSCFCLFFTIQKTLHCNIPFLIQSFNIFVRHVFLEERGAYSEVQNNWRMGILGGENFFHILLVGVGEVGAIGGRVKKFLKNENILKELLFNSKSN